MNRPFVIQRADGHYDVTTTAREQEGGYWWQPTGELWMPYNWMRDLGCGRIGQELEAEDWLSKVPPPPADAKWDFPTGDDRSTRTERQREQINRLRETISAMEARESAWMEKYHDQLSVVNRLESEHKRLFEEVKSIPQAWPDDVPLAGPNRPANDGTTAWLIGYLRTVLKRFGNTCVTADLQWGASALHVMHKEREENKRLVGERDMWKGRAQRAEAEAMTLRDFERDRQNTKRRNPQDGDDAL